MKIYKNLETPFLSFITRRIAAILILFFLVHSFSFAQNFSEQDYVNIEPDQRLTRVLKEKQIQQALEHKPYKILQLNYFLDQGYYLAEDVHTKSKGQRRQYRKLDVLVFGENVLEASKRKDKNNLSKLTELELMKQKLTPIQKVDLLKIFQKIEDDYSIYAVKKDPSLLLKLTPQSRPKGVKVTQYFVDGVKPFFTDEQWGLIETNITVR